MAVRCVTSAPTYDVVLVTYNSSDCLTECLGAVASFFEDRESDTIVVDNDSSDDSVVVALRADPTARVIRNERNVGFATAVNQAIREGRGDWVVLVNPDVSRIEGSVEAFESVATDDRVAAIATRMTDGCGVLARTCHAAPTPFTMLSENLALHERFPRWSATRRYRMLDWDMTSPRDVDDACGGFLALRRTAIESIGPLDERFFLYVEETDWLTRAREAGWRVTFTPEIEVVHSSGGSSDASREVLSAYLLRSQYLYLRKHFGAGAEWSLRVVLIGLDALRWALGILGPARREKSREAARRMRIHLGLGRRRA